MNSILIRHSYLPVRQCWLTGGKRFLSAANRRVFAGIGTDSRLRFFSSKVDNGRPVNRGRITALQDTTCALDQSKLAVESNAGGDTPLPLSIEMQNFIRDLQNAFVAGDERIISRLMAVANSDPAVASTVGFQHLLDACISQFCSPRGTCDNRHIENRFIKHSVPWLLQMSYSTRLKYIEEIMHLAKSCDKIFFPRFAAAFFIALSEKKLVQLAAVDKLNLTSDVSLPGDAVLSTLRRMLLAPNKKPAIMFLITMFRRGIFACVCGSIGSLS